MQHGSALDRSGCKSLSRQRHTHADGRALEKKGLVIDATAFAVAEFTRTYLIQPRYLAAGQKQSQQVRAWIARHLQRTKIAASLHIQRLAFLIP